MNRLKLFLENFLIYGFGTIIVKLIPIILIPILTYLYPSSKYMGINDLTTIVLSFLTAIALFGMYDSAFRFCFDQESAEKQKVVCYTSLLFVLKSSGLVSVIVILFRTSLSVFVYGTGEYSYLIVIVALNLILSNLNSIFSIPTRIQNKRLLYVVVNAVVPIITYTGAIVLILNHIYIISIPVAMCVASGISCFIYWIINRAWFQVKKRDKELELEMLKFGAPLVPIFLIYWLYSSADKLMITKFLGAEMTGIYAVASKFGAISNLIYSAFAGGWSYFAYATMNDKDQIQLKSKIFEYLGIISIVATLLLMSIVQPLFGIVFEESYYEGYIIAPYLFLAPLLLMLFQVLANQLAIIKKTYYTALLLGIGAVINIILNYYLIHSIGMEGASIATLCGYIISVVACYILLRKQHLVKVPFKFWACCLIFGLDFIVWRLLFLSSNMAMIGNTVILLLVIVAIYRKEIMKFFNRIKAVLVNKNTKKF